MTDPSLDPLDCEILKLSALSGLVPEARALILAAGALQNGLLTLEEAVERLQRPNLEGFNLPTAAGAVLGQELARVTGEVPGCCPTCAFKLGTVPNQCDTTVKEAIDCVFENVPFHCHHDAKPCRGWLAARAQIDKTEAAETVKP